MNVWTPEEIERLYQKDRASIQRAPRHEDETLAHRLITLYEAWGYIEEMLNNQETHKEFESLIRQAREGRRDRMNGLSEVQVDAEPDVARRKVVMYVLNRMKVMFA